jgi:hypothetical protein
MAGVLANPKNEAAPVEPLSDKPYSGLPEPTAFSAMKKPEAAAPAPEVQKKPVPAPVQAKPVETPVRGKQVMTVNRKFNFVVINLGLKDGVKMGDRVVTERDGKPSGVAEVEKLYDSFSAATIVEERESGAIREGDAVRPA